MNSVLNPEAPEFYPHLTSVTQGGYTTVHRTIRSSNHMPLGASYDLFKTFTDFNVVTRQLSENVVVQTNQILITELPAVKLKLNDNEYNTEKVVGANDCILDRAYINLDTLTGANQPSDDFAEALRRGGAWNATPIISKIEVGSTTFIGAKNIPRPQLLFKEPVDNSESLWVPKISDKPNNIKPLALSILYNDEGEAVGYEHPYKVELELYQPPGELLEPDPAPPAFPPPLEDTPLTFVDSADQVDRLVEHLATVAEMAVDLEHHSYRSYQGITCLIQISTSEGGDFLVDALAVREHIHKLNVIFTDPKKLKVFHGAESDVVWLQRDFGVYVVGLFDTHRAARQLALPALSLKGLLAHYCRVAADKKFQLADWRIRPLPAELAQYARTDTHYLLYVWRRMKADLLARVAGPRQLLAVFDASRQVCGATYNKEAVREDSHLALYVRSRKHFNSQQLAALKMLYKWRDAHARDLDESTTYLLPNHMLMSLAETLPREVQGVHACCSPTPPFVKQHLLTIHRMLLSCRELPPEPQLLAAPASVRALAAPAPAAPPHDLAHLPQYSEDQPINLEHAAELLGEGFLWRPDVRAFEPAYLSADPALGVVSDLNVDAKLFIPPYDRYRKYRSLAQIEEIKEFKDKEAKIAAISKGNELIKTEVLMKLQRAASHIAANDAPPAPPAPAPAPAHDAGNKAQRKRKISDKERKEPPLPTKPEAPAAPPAAPPAPAAKPKSVKLAAEPCATLKPSLYKNVNYRKFYDAEKTRKQPKMKFKKHK